MKRMFLSMLLFNGVPQEADEKPESPKLIVHEWGTFTTVAGSYGPVVYHGQLDGAKKPCQVRAKKVFSQISEYKKIKEMGLKEDDAEYWLLLKKANAKFNTAVNSVVSGKGYDVVIEKGTAKFQGPAPEETNAVIAALE